jgi:hypothetical protein
MRRALVIGILVTTLAHVVDGQPVLQRGDVLMSHYDYEAFSGTIVVFSRDGAFKGELITFPNHIFDILYRDGIIYVAARPDIIERVDVHGSLLTPFTSEAAHANYLSPGPEGGLIAVSVSDLYQFSADGSRVRHRIDDLMAGDAIDLGSDGCTVFSGDGRLRKWHACVDSPVTSFGDEHGAGSSGLRVLRDGTFLLDDISGSGVRHVDANGSLIRAFGPGGGLALDIDGRSFWTIRGCGVARIDIATGAVITTSEQYPGCTDSPVGLTVIGEPRAAFAAMHAGEPAIPTLSRLPLVLLGVALRVAAWLKMGLR